MASPVQYDHSEHPVFSHIHILSDKLPPFRSHYWQLCSAGAHPTTASGEISLFWEHCVFILGTSVHGPPTYPLPLLLRSSAEPTGPTPVFASRFCMHGSFPRQDEGKVPVFVQASKSVPWPRVAPRLRLSFSLSLFALSHSGREAHKWHTDALCSLFLAD
jgi:hypothetical protein